MRVPVVPSFRDICIMYSQLSWPGVAGLPRRIWQRTFHTVDKSKRKNLGLAQGKLQVLSAHMQSVEAKKMEVLVHIWFWSPLQAYQKVQGLRYLRWEEWRSLSGIWKIQAIWGRMEAQEFENAESFSKWENYVFLTILIKRGGWKQTGTRDASKSLTMTGRRWTVLLRDFEASSALPHHLQYVAVWSAGQRAGKGDWGRSKMLNDSPNRKTRVEKGIGLCF